MRAIVILLLFIATSTSFATENTVFIGQVRVDDARTITHSANHLQYNITHSNPDLLQDYLVEWFPNLDTHDANTSIRVDNYPLASKAFNKERHLASTFLVDFTEPDIQELIPAIESAHGKTPSAIALEQFVFDYISDKNFANGFDIASQTARSREGDCTEHAVLLTALLRMYGYPARIVTGVYVDLSNTINAYGHAWTEYYDSQGWVGLDATQISEAVDRQHIPLAAVEDESIGFSLGLIKLLQTQAIEKIVVTN